jgi:glycosyltransferase A (GT-A) superfamily protein (DUF2064 family)
MRKKPISNTAVIFFSLTPREEARQKSFVSGGEFVKNFRIAGLLRDHVKRQIDQTDLPCFLFDEHNQKGKTFGEKFVHALDGVFNKGFDNVIVVGSDTPMLQSEHVLKAADALQTECSDVVLGPAGDGGTWLMGFSRRSFNADIVKDLHWKTDNLLNSVIEQLGGSHLITFLDTFEDLDSDVDLQNFLRGPNTRDGLTLLKKKIHGILEPVHVEFFLNQTSLKSTDQSYSFLLRGPPAAPDYSPIK